VSEYTLYHGDCLDVLPTLEAGSVDAVICDPPYGTTACKWDSVIPFAPMWAVVKRVLKPRGACVLFGSQPFTSALVMSNPDMFRYEWVWEKDRASGFLDAATRPLKAHENIIVFADSEPSYNPQKTTGHPATHRTNSTGGRQLYRADITGRASGGQTDRFPRSIQKFNVVNSMHKPIHPTQKPLALLEYLVKTYTNEGETVLDFTMGSGTTGHACGNLGRRFVGIEKDANYFAIASERIATAYEPLRAMQGVA
jgi:site-specific DNA-methyltransferase (adenine-specific)